MENLKSNSDKSREPREKKEKVISGSAKKAKKSIFQKAFKVFVNEDVDDIKSYICNDVLIPSLKRTFLDTINTIFGGSTYTTRSNTSRSGSLIRYDKAYTISPVAKTNNVQAQPAVKLDYANVTFDSRSDAVAVLNALNDTINEFDDGFASIADLYELAGIPCDNNYGTFNKYGWRNLDGSEIRSTSDGYMLILPKPRLA